MATQDRPPAPPKGLDASGRRLWKSVVTDYDLDVHEQLLLVQACRCVDRLDRLAEEAAAAEVTVINARGDQVPHPTLTEVCSHPVGCGRGVFAGQTGLVRPKGFEPLTF
jgi:hypothetical protein